MVEEIDVSYRSCEVILTENLGMIHVSAKFIPQLLTQEQKENCLFMSSDLLECADTDENFLKYIVTGD
jgi:hypothetical protein